MPMHQAFPAISSPGYSAWEANGKRGSLPYHSIEQRLMRMDNAPNGKGREAGWCPRAAIPD
jgi:hypothetical protein